MTDGEYHIRRADTGELPCVVSLWLAMMGEHEEFEPDLRLAPNAGPSYHSFLLLNCNNPRSRVLVVEHKKGVHAFCVAYITANLPMFLPEDFGYISDIYVAPSHRSRGIGTSLLCEVYGWFRQEGIETVHLQVYSKNLKGRTFWEQTGYKPMVLGMWRDLDIE